MTTLTIDVGLKNLAMCIMSCSGDTDGCEGPETASGRCETASGRYCIKLWDVYNTLETESESATCRGITKAGKVCGKKCTYKYTTDTDTVTVEKDETETLPTGSVTVYSCKPHFPKTIKMTTRNKITKKRVDEYLLQDITRTILLKTVEIYQSHREIFDSVTKVLIELQPKVNNKMKLISHLIYGKFVEIYLDRNVPIRFVKASQKLKVYRGPTIECKLKDSYSRRKRLSIEYTKWFLEKGECIKSPEKWMTQFMSNTKKDDLGDVFLMAINDLKSGLVVQKTNRVKRVPKVKKTRKK
jgi:hypothetical protein